MKWTAVLSLALAATSAFAQFSIVPSRAAMNANDTLTWNQIGPNGTVVPLPFSAVSDRGVRVNVTGNAPNTQAVVTVAGSSPIPPWGFNEDETRLEFVYNLVEINFDPPVLAVGLNVAAELGGDETGSPISFNAFRGTTPIGGGLVSSAARQDDFGTAPFVGVRDEGGITRIRVFRLICSTCLSQHTNLFINQLSLVSPQRVSLNAKQGNGKNVIVANSNARSQFSILSAPGFDASTAVDLASLRYGRTGEELSILNCTPGIDTNRDGLPDLSCQFSVASAAFQPGDLTAKFKGKLTNGAPIYGSVDVLVK